jgi:hypothetical protein
MCYIKWLHIQKHLYYVHCNGYDDVFNSKAAVGVWVLECILLTTMTLWFIRIELKMLQLYPLFITLSKRMSDHIIIGISFKHGDDSQASVIVLITQNSHFYCKLLELRCIALYPPRGNKFLKNSERMKNVMWKAEIFSCGQWGMHLNDLFQPNDYIRPVFF